LPPAAPAEHLLSILQDFSPLVKSRTQNFFRPARRNGEKSRQYAQNVAKFPEMLDLSAFLQVR
jgi:hypothetical protein